MADSNGVTGKMPMLLPRYPEGPLLRIPDDLDVPDLASEEVVHVSSARVVVAEYEVLQHDFPELRTETLNALNPQLQALQPQDREAAANAIIDQWLLTHAAYISTQQAAHAVVNTPIKTDRHRTTAYRPPGYGRAVVLPIPHTRSADTDPTPRWLPSTGMLDLKGAGIAPDRTPVLGYRSTGLEYVGVALSDFLIKRAIDEILARELPTVWTVPVYAVLDLGFDIVNDYLGTARAGLHVRRAHRRFLAKTDRSTMQRVAITIESALRRYGLTAAARGLQLHLAYQNGRVSWQRGNNRPFAPRDKAAIAVSMALLNRACPLTIDQHDVQLARDVSWPPAQGQMLDFGALRVEASFERPMRRQLGGLSLDDVIWSDSPDFVQPDPRLRLPVTFWKRQNLVAWCFKVTRQLTEGEISAREFRRLVDAPLLSLLEQWAGPPDVSIEH